MQHPVNLSQTYLYKVHSLSSLLDRVFDRTLRSHADITLSQFLVLLAIAQSPGINQRQVAKYLTISPVAVKRQVDIAKRRAWVGVIASDARGDGLQVTDEGGGVIAVGLQALEWYAFSIFGQHNQSLNLMQHLDLLLSKSGELLQKD